LHHREPPIQVDIHTHVLPGIDDGARDIEQALAMLRVAAADGTQIVVATPHARRTDVAQVVAAVERLQEAIDRQSLPLQLASGMEEQLWPDLVDRLLVGTALTLCGTRWVLVELPDWTVWPSDLTDRLLELRAAGFRPILAHVERYGPIQRQPERLLEAIATGALIQVNADSLFGQNGYAAQQVALRLIRAGAVSVLASDAHHPEWRAPRLRPAFERLAALFGEEVISRLQANAVAVVRDQDVASPSPDPDMLSTSMTLLERVRAWVGF
jgi:protein-tyrosine phosphatase